MKRTKRILLCAHEYPPHGSGIAYVAKNLAQALRKEGHDVLVCSPTGPEIALGSQTLINKTGGLGILVFWRRVRRYLKKRGEQYDIIWCHNPLFTKPVAHPGFVATVHTTYHERSATIKNERVSRLFRTYYAFMRSQERRAFAANKHATYTVTSSLTVEEIKKLGVQQRPQLIPNGVDTARFKPGAKKELRRQLGITLTGNVFLNVSRMMPQKRHLLLIKVFKKFATKEDELIICGDGPLWNSVAAAAENDPRIRLTGRIPQEKLLEYYQAADFYIMPSAYEGQPLALLEAMACGLLPILSDIPIFQETVQTLGHGLTLNFEAKNAPTHIRQYVTRRKSNEAKALARVMRAHDWRRVAHQYEGLFTEVTT